MNKILVLIVWVVMLIANAKAFDVTKLVNNKETISRRLTTQDAQRSVNWANSHRMNGQDLRSAARRVLGTVFNQVEKSDVKCELGLAENLAKAAVQEGIIYQEEEAKTYVAYLRHANLIDDILYAMLVDSIAISDEFRRSAQTYPNRPFNLYTRYTAGFDYKSFYAPVASWPDEKKACAIDMYFGMVRTLKWKNYKDLDAQMLRYNYIAYINGTITLEAFNKMEVLRKHKALEWPVYLNRYFDVVVNAKDRLTKTPEEASSNDFSSTYISRKDKLTNRSHLYANYNSTQIMMLAQIMERTAKRMDSRRVTLNWQYTDDPAGENEVYVFSPMEQYRASIRMLKKDMAEVMRSDAFRGTGFRFSHLIAASYEAGFIKSDELDQVLKFEAFWNPQTPKWKAYSDFAFSLAGSASFYLPAPWNVIGAIGLILTQSKVNGEPDPEFEDSWNVII